MSLSLTIEEKQYVLDIVESLYGPQPALEHSSS